MLPCLLASLAADLAKPAANGTQLASSPSVWITQDFLEGAHIDGVLGMLPTTESHGRRALARSPSLLEALHDSTRRRDADGALISLIERVSAFGVDATALRRAGSPSFGTCRCTSAGVRGDIGHDGLVPNATLILYLTDSEHDSGKTWFHSSADTMARTV